MVPIAKAKRAGAWGLLAASMLLSCEEEQTPRAGAPPPPPAAKPAACEGGGGTLKDADSAGVFPRQTGSFCLDPNDKGQVFGEGGDLPLEQICDLFDGECEIYKGFQVRRVAKVRYVDGKGSEATIDINLSKYASSDAAYGMFTKRTVGDGDPADEATPAPFDAGGAAALGLGNAYLWRGPYLAEITYNDPTASVKELEANAGQVLQPLTKAIGEKLPGETKLPDAVSALPDKDMLPMGRRLVLEDVLGIEGLGGGAFGYYRDGEQRFRMVSVLFGDEDQAKDAMKSVAKSEGATPEDDLGDAALRFMIAEGELPPAEWIVARKGPRLLGIGDEQRVLRAGMTNEEHKKLTLTREEKTARLKAALTEPAPTEPAPTEPAPTE
jgi:hypothetical protein